MKKIRRKDMSIPHETIQAVLDAWEAVDFPDEFE